MTLLRLLESGRIAMTATLEFVGYFASVAGETSFRAEMKNSDPTVRDLLIRAEEDFSERSLVVLKQDEPRQGVLVFHRTATGGMVRIFDLDTPLQTVGSRILLAAEMEGG